MTARFHLTVPTTTAETAILPGFMTDLRPAARLREPLQRGPHRRTLRP